MTNRGQWTALKAAAWFVCRPAMLCRLPLLSRPINHFRDPDRFSGAVLFGASVSALWRLMHNRNRGIDARLLFVLAGRVNPSHQSVSGARHWRPSLAFHTGPQTLFSALEIEGGGRRTAGTRRASARTGTRGRSSFRCHRHQFPPLLTQIIEQLVGPARQFPLPFFTPALFAFHFQSCEGSGLPSAYHRCLFE
jgi:hypothetical protein